MFWKTRDGGNAPEDDQLAEPDRRTTTGSCALCKTEQQTLSELPCCGELVCDPSGLTAALEGSCYSNHRKHTLCGYHWKKRHEGEWKECTTCRDDINHAMYCHLGTNEYNFEKLPNVARKPPRPPAKPRPPLEPEVVDCPHCGSARTVAGLFGAPRYYRPFFALRDAKWLSKVLGTRLTTIQTLPRACADCGFVWCGLDVATLREKINDHGTDELKERVGLAEEKTPE